MPERHLPPATEDSWWLPKIAPSALEKGSRKLEYAAMIFDKLFNQLGHLPVAKVADECAEAVLDRTVTVLASETGSGKTLFQTTRLAALSVRKGMGPVIVLEPRRFLAVNAAETIAHLAGCEVGTLVGYALGSQSGDTPQFDRKQTKLLFATYGYALSSGLIFKAPIMVLDEVHEKSMEMSICRAILRMRAADGESVKVLEMSATIDEAEQAKYWEPVAKTGVYRIDGKTYPCERRYRPAGDPAGETIELIKEGRRGILVFEPGVSEVEETAKKTKKLADDLGMQIEVATIYGDMSYDERAESVTPPQDGGVKVLVGTNVVESGANIPWLDAGVSTGVGKENSIRPETGATVLAEIDLPQWRLDQQEGRVKRFRPGVFVLCSLLAREKRAVATTPEIKRVALTDLVMHCAAFGLRAHDLTFDHVPDPEKVKEAETKLQRLGLIDEDCALTDAGEFVVDLPVGPETGAMLWYAHNDNCLDVVIPLAAVIEVGGLRKDFRDAHHLDTTSDFLDGLRAFVKASLVPAKEWKSTLEKNNIGRKRFEAATELVEDLERRLGQKASPAIDDSLVCLRRSILAGYIDNLYIGNELNRRYSSVKNRMMSYEIGRGSSVGYVNGDQFVVGLLRMIRPKNTMDRPFTVIEKVTVVSIDDIKALARFRPEILKTEVKDETFFGRRQRLTTTLLFGMYMVTQTMDILEEAKPIPMPMPIPMPVVRRPVVLPERLPISQMLFGDSRQPTLASLLGDALAKGASRKG